MTHAEVLRYVCRTYALAYHSIGDYRYACDGFCDLCPNAGDPESYRNDGHALRWVREAVLEKLERDGFTPDLKTVSEDTSKDVALSARVDQETAYRKELHGQVEEYVRAVFRQRDQEKEVR